MQGTMSLSSLFSMRPVAGYANYRSPIRGLYMCGAATHPGGGVMGASGYNAAREILRDVGRGRSTDRKRGVWPALTGEWATTGKTGEWTAEKRG